MFCKKCGNQINEGQKFCQNCGEKVEIETKEENVNVAPEVTNTEVKTQVADTTITNNQEMNNNENNNLNTYSTVNTSVSSNVPKKKSNLPLIITFIVLGLIIVGLIIFIAVTVINKDDDSASDDKEIVEKDDTKEEEEVKKEIITATNYDYEKLDGYQYVIKSNRLNVTNNNADFVAALQNMSEIYSALEPNLEILKQRFISTGYTVNNAYSATYETTKFLVFEMTYLGQNLVLFYAEHPDKTIVCGSIQLKSSSYTFEDALKDMSKIINASEKSTGTTTTDDSSSESFDANISDIFE